MWSGCCTTPFDAAVTDPSLWATNLYGWHLQQTQKFPFHHHLLFLLIYGFLVPHTLFLNASAEKYSCSEIVTSPDFAMTILQMPLASPTCSVIMCSHSELPLWRGCLIWHCYSHRFVVLPWMALKFNIFIINDALYLYFEYCLLHCNFSLPSFRNA